MVPYMLVLPAAHPGQFVIFLGRPSTAAGVVIRQIAQIQFFLYTGRDACTIVLTYNQGVAGTPAMRGSRSAASFETR
jgi:hypothetical protein